MLSAIRPVRSLLASIFILMAGAGFISTFIGLRLEASGRSALMVGLLSAAYFSGLTIGSLRAGAVIAQVGHIRAFAAFVSLLSATTLAYATNENLAIWALLRLADGLCVAGVYVCLESWLNARAETQGRGAVLAGYMVALYAGQALGQFLLNVSDDKPSMPFVVASILISLAVIPVALTRGASPPLGEPSVLPLRRLYEISPLGSLGAAITGLMMGAFYGLGAIYARRLGFDLAATATFMSVVILGGVALQWPIGWLSDHFDRRRVILGAFAGVALVSALLVAIGPSRALVMLLGMAFGGLCFALYPLCVAHTNDHLEPDMRVGASGGLVLVYSVGAALGPLAGATAMTLGGASGLFQFVALAAAGALVFGLWRLRARAPTPAVLQQAYRTLPRTTPMAATLDPRGDDVSEIYSKEGPSR